MNHLGKCECGSAREVVLRAPGVSWELSREVTDLQEPSVKDTNVKLRKNTPGNYVKHLRYVMFCEFPQLVNKKYFFCTFSKISI